MRNILTLFALLLARSASAAVGPLINGNQINPHTAISISSLSVTGGGGMAVTNSITASSMTATGSGFKGAGTGLTGTAAGLTAGNVTTNANLTGAVTSVGNATTIVGPVPTSGVDLSTVTTALALKAPLASPTFTGTVIITGNSFTVGTSSFVVSGGSVSIGYGLTVGSTITSRGNTNGTAACTGCIGEVISANGSARSPASDTSTSFSTITLTAGVWDVCGYGSFNPGTLNTQFFMAISATNDAFDSSNIGGRYQHSQVYTGGTNEYFSLGCRRVVLTSSTPYYLVCRTSWSGTAGQGGSDSFICAVRNR